MWRGAPRPGSSIPRCRPSLLAGEDSICSGCVPLQHRARLAALSPEIYEVPLKGVVLEGEGWKDLQKMTHACYPDESSVRASGSGCPNY